MIKNIYYYFLNKQKEKKVKNLLELNKYLDKFNYDIHEEDIPKENSNYIWQLWFQGEENTPQIVKKCLKSVQKYHSDKKIIVLDNKSIEKYLEIPSFMKDKYKCGIIKHAHYSDYIRTCLLAKYGGIWIDATVLLTNNIPDEILNQDFFVFKNPVWFENKIVPSEALFKVFLSLFKETGFYGSSWFIVSKADNSILKLQQFLIEQYWNEENDLLNYFMYHFLISKSLIKNIECRKIFNKMLSISNEAPHFLQKMLNEKFSKEEFEAIKKATSIHKITYKYKNIKPGSYLEYILKENL